MTNILVTTIWNLCGVIGGPKPLGDGLEADDGTDSNQIHLSCQFSAAHFRRVELRRVTHSTLRRKR